MSSIESALRARRGHRRAQFHRPQLEGLETRITPSTFIVNSTGDESDSNPGDGIADTGTGASGAPVVTLRAAIEEAEALAGPDRIEFDIQGAGVQTISPGSGLPTIRDSLEIDGYTQPGASRNTLQTGSDAVLLIRINGGGLNADGLSVRGDTDVTIEGLVITGFQNNGIGVSASGVTIIGNFIGIEPDGQTPNGNRSGIFFGEGTFCRVGGELPAERNIISGNTNIGVEFNDSSNIRVEGNYIGTNSAGTMAVPNQDNGVYIHFGSSNTIGGASDEAGNLISGNNQKGILVNDADDTLIQNNLIGTDATGTAPLGNLREGIELKVNSNNTRILKNVIAANQDDGIAVLDSDTTDTTIQGNYIGTDVTGNVALGNFGRGIRIDEASDITIGGFDEESRNIIAANSFTGIDVFGVGQALTRILGNHIGIGADGSTALGNQGAGIDVFSSDGVTIGGTAPGAGNVISVNADGGIRLFDSSGTIVQGNLIGTAADGVTPRGNDGDGIAITFDNGAMIGGTVPGAGNVIAFSEFDGISVVSGDTENSILGNSIHSNGGLGIDLEGNDDAFGVSPNDPGDQDTGGNDLQNFPAITSVTPGLGGVVIAGTLNSTPNTFFLIQFFASPDADPSGHGEGKDFLGQVNVKTDGSGDVGFSTQPLPVPQGSEFISATATELIVESIHPFGSTSEFSGAVAIAAEEVGNADLFVDIDDSADPVSVGDEVTYMIVVGNNGPDMATGVMVTAALPAGAIFVSATGGATPVGGVVTFPVRDLERPTEVPDLVTLELTIRPTLALAGSVFAVSATATSIEQDTNPENDTDSENTTVGPEADLSLEKSVSPHDPRVGQQATYTLTVTNHGPNAAEAVKVFDTLPTNAEFISASGGATPNQGVVEFDVGALPNGESASFQVVMMMTGGEGDSVNNTASATSSTHDPGTGNNSDFSSFDLETALAPNLVVTLTDDVDPATLGQDITYKLTVGNSGDAPATGVGVVVSLPSGVTLVSAGGGTPGQNGSLNFDIGTVEPGSSEMFQIVVRPESTGTLTLSAVVFVGESPSGPAIEQTTTIQPAQEDVTPPTVISLLRFGYHTQPTLLVVTFSEPVDPYLAGSTQSYVVLSPGRDRRFGTADDGRVFVDAAFYNAETNQATLRLSRALPLFHHDFLLTVDRAIRDLAGNHLGGDGDEGEGGDVRIPLNHQNLAGTAWDAPAAELVGVSRRVSSGGGASHPHTPRPRLAVSRTAVRSTQRTIVPTRVPRVVQQVKPHERWTFLKARRSV
jgi:uncharacterized repeat protein (TIGR01451 family)